MGNRPHCHFRSPFPIPHSPVPPMMKKVLSLLLVASAAGAQMRSIPRPLVTAPSPDPRVGLKAGLQDAGQAIWNLRLVSHVQSPDGFAGVTNSDLAFYKQNVIQG